jgi:hypothetical protein
MPDPGRRVRVVEDQRSAWTEEPSNLAVSSFVELKRVVQRR